jgi:integrase
MSISHSNEQKVQNSSSYKRVGDNLYQNPASGTYFAVVRQNGKLVKSTLKTTIKVEAKRKLAMFVAELEKVESDGAKMTVGLLVDRYLETLGVQAASTTAKKRTMATAIKADLGAKRARSVTASDILKWRTGLTMSRTDEKLGPNSRNKYLRTLRAIFKLAVDDRLLAASPVMGIKEEKLPKPIRETPSFEEFAAIVDSIRKQPLSDTREESADYVEFLGLAGLGLAEASSLSWGDVNLDRNEIITFRHKTLSGFRVPIYPQLRPLLEKRLKFATERGGVAPLPSERVFAVQDPKKAIESACLRLGFIRQKGDRGTARYSSRSLRRLFITMALERGVDVGVVADWQGHKDGGKLILSTYRHARQSHGDAMAKLMGFPEPVPHNVVQMAVSA